MKMRNLITIILKIAIAGLISIVLLSGFVFFYQNSGVHIANKTGATDYKWEPYQRMYTMTEGFSFLRMDKDGFNNSITKDQKIDFLLMGSSQMEATNVGSDENVAYLLNSWFPDKYTYNIGISGHDIYHCLNNISDAIKTYKPQRAIILVVDDISLSINKMNQVLNQKFERIPSYDSGWLYKIQKNIPAIKVIYKKIDDWKSVDTKKEVTTEGTDLSNDGYQEILSKFLLMGKDAAEENGCHLIILYQPMTKIMSSGEYNTNWKKEARSYFSEACLHLGIEYIDMSEPFETFYNEHYTLAHGFINTSVGDGHLNKYGHKLIAEELAKVIKEADK